MANGVQTRSAAAASLRKRITDAAVELLIEEGVGRTTTLAVQKRAGVSRGALLHHFPNRAQLLASTIEQLVQRNERQIDEAFISQAGQGGDVEQALQALSDNMAQPSYLAEMELWTLARNDHELREALYVAEKAARYDLDRVVGRLLDCWRHHPDYPMLADLSVEFLRGLAFSDLLRNRPSYRYRMISLWVELINRYLESRTEEGAEAGTGRDPG